MQIRIQFLQKEDAKKLKNLEKNKQLADLLFEGRLHQKRNKLIKDKAKVMDQIQKRAHS